MNDREMDNLLNDFFTSSDVPSNDQFVENVMLSLPPVSKWVWVRDMFPAAILFVVLLAVWKIKILTPKALWIMASEGIAVLQSQWQVFTPTTVFALLTMLFMAVCYFAYETYAEI